MSLAISQLETTRNHADYALESMAGCSNPISKGWLARTTAALARITFGTQLALDVRAISRTTCEPTTWQGSECLEMEYQCGNRNARIYSDSNSYEIHLFDASNDYQEMHRFLQRQEALTFARRWCQW